MSLGLAYAANGKSQAAANLLARAEGKESASYRQILLRARAEVNEGLAAAEQPWSEQADRYWLAALQDYRSLVQAAPDDLDANNSIGYILEELGAYAEAIEHYEKLLAQHPDQAVRFRVRLGAVHRRAGDYDKALDQLNQLVASEGPQDGMRYHYHRGWTLIMLRRFDEAIAELTEGLKDQPDYAFAQLRRSCAYASVGELSEAVRDAAEAAAELERIADASDQSSLRFDIHRAKQVVVELSTAVQAGRRDPHPQTCLGFSGRTDEPRTRSALLPAA